MKLWVLWQIPNQQVSTNNSVLSFLPPADEELIASQPGVRLIHGRERSPIAQSEVVGIYREVVARIGLGLVEPTRTLRQALARPGQASRWWFHAVTKRDPESEPQFEWILHVLIIQSVVKELGATSVALVGAPSEVADIVKSFVRIETKEGERTPAGGFHTVLQFFRARVLYLLKFIYFRAALSMHYRLPICRYDFVFSSFWDWAFKSNGGGNDYVDRYFKRLPNLIMRSGQQRAGYFAWFDPLSDPRQRWRRLDRVLAPLRGNNEVVLLQALLRLSDAVEAVFDLTPILVLRKALRSSDFRESFVHNGLDWLPIFRPVLTRGCLDASIPHFELIALATQRAAERYQPRLTLSFLEHFPHARAHYEGMRRAKVSAENWAMQHAGVCPEKTFYFLHPEYEFKGAPDGCAVPHPTQVFVMGEMGYASFLVCGYDPAQLHMTGSTRYDHVRIAEQETEGTARNATGVRILLACSLDLEIEIALVEAAALAVRGMTKVALRLRNHPFGRVDRHPRFRISKDVVAISESSLEADLSWADIVLFSYSTVADEAFLQGKPCWQWLPVGFDGSPLAKAVPIPRFGSVGSLRAAIQKYETEPSAPSDSEINAAALALFAPVDGHAAERIATQIEFAIRATR